ncbi:MAG: four helix bundle suffix domain-containing protein [Dehalococcoidia bacterium]|nr:four helix bundle suffix domain-containing protein [Dehalococcoidia bacterium]
MSDAEPLIPRHGGYRNLKSFQIAQLAYDVTVLFCDNHIDQRSRTHDQMVQAARSGVQNIAEGSQASGTSKKMEMKLTSVARASLEELRLDYEDFLRQRRLCLWDWKDPRRAGLIALRPGGVDDVVRWVHGVLEHDKGQVLDGRVNGSEPPSIPSTSSISPGVGGDGEVMANGVLALITVAASLLDRQLAAQAAAFERDGGFTERLYGRRRAERNG